MSKDLLDRVRIGTPCQTDWDAMRGDDRVRYCGQCDKQVYNLSQMTRQQAEALILKTNGKMCARFERRADGGIVTTDESLALPRFKARFLRIASATMSAALSLSPSVLAKTPRNLPILQQQDKKEKPTDQPQEKDKVGRIYGKVVDLSEAVIPNTAITAINETTKQTWKTISSADGEYDFLLPLTGSYSLTFEAAGFIKLTQIGLSLKNDSPLNVIITMRVNASEALAGVVVIVPEEPLVKPSVADENLKLNLKEPSVPIEELPPLQNKKVKKSLLDVLLAPIKKITDNKNDN